MITFRRHQDGSGEPGFSIIEILVVIAILGVLVSILFPVLSSMRDRSRRVVDLSNLRTHAQSFAMYRGDHKGLFTRPFEANGEWYTRYWLTDMFELPVRYLDTHQYWHHRMLDYYEADSASEVFLPPDQDDRQFRAFDVETPYSYGCAFIADAKLWNPESRRGIDQWRATSEAHVRHPSRKALIVQIWPYYEALLDSGQTPSAPMAAVDGSAAVIAPESILPGYPSGEGGENNMIGATHFGDYPPMLHTIDGVRGQDFTR